MIRIGHVSWDRHFGITLCQALGAMGGRPNGAPKGISQQLHQGGAEIECEDEAGGEAKEVDCLALLPRCRTYT